MTMTNIDAFGLRLGSKVSKAARLAARRAGATMAEIKEATGDKGSKYNIFEILKGKGHIVTREGGRIFLKHKDGTVPEESPSEPTVPWQPLPERRLQEALRGCLDKLEPGLVAIDGGKEDGDRDITAKDQAGNLVVIELKNGKAGRDAITQLLVYMGELKRQNPSVKIRGILVAHDFQATAVDAAGMVPNITLKHFPG
jgi:hypothetical protein